MNADHDRGLKDAFKALGAVGRATGPSFRQVASREALNAARWRRRRRRAALLVFVVVTPAFYALRARTDRGLDYDRFTALTGLDLGEVTWEAPSDFLLDVPGRDLLRRVPIIEIRSPAPAADSVRPPDSNDTQRRSRS
jgi:hypothetical protein